MTLDNRYFFFNFQKFSVVFNKEIICNFNYKIQIFHLNSNY